VNLSPVSFDDWFGIATVSMASTAAMSKRTGFEPTSKTRILPFTIYHFPLFMANAFSCLLNSPTMHIKPIENNRIAMLSLKTLYPGGIRTRVFRF
jgi:hypothetical protein